MDRVAHKIVDRLGNFQSIQYSTREVELYYKSWVIYADFAIIAEGNINTVRCLAVEVFDEIDQIDRRLSNLLLNKIDRICIEQNKWELRNG